MPTSGQSYRAVDWIRPAASSQIDEECDSVQLQPLYRQGLEAMYGSAARNSALTGINSCMYVLDRFSSRQPENKTNSEANTIFQVPTSFECAHTTEAPLPVYNGAYCCWMRIVNKTGLSPQTTFAASDVASLMKLRLRNLGTPPFW